MKLFPLAALCVLSLCLTTAPTAFAEPASDEDLKAIRKSLDDIKASQAELNKQVQEIKGQLKATAAKPATPAAGATTATATPRPNPVAVLNNIPYDLAADGRTTGSADAKVVVMEFTDLQCVFCAAYHTNGFQQVMNEYVVPGKVRYAFRDLPIPGHKNEIKFAKTARCAAEKGKFWEVHDYIFRHQDKLNLDNVTTEIASLGLDVNELNNCVASDAMVADINKNGMDAMKMGATGAPSIFIALADGPDKVKVVRKIRGGNYQLIKTALDEVLTGVQGK